ncbi:MAG: hypothetical protein JXR96_29975 [Deltaproteobacteria bacterium]|nr:hypothetical protein [Deltaproteobacteria bacterium]
MPRITISIPADLKALLASPALRKSVNISRICQEALRREARRLLQLPGDLLSLQAALERLREQKERLSLQWHAEGARAAEAWVEAEADYTRLRQVGLASDRLALIESDPPPALEEALRAHAGRPDFDQAAFLRGWAQALGMIWAALEPHL